MIKRSLNQVAPFAILIVFLLLAACGPSGGSATGATNSDQTVPLLPLQAPDASSDVSAPAEVSPTAVSSGEVDAHGIPVGFTDDGRPYRGQLNAPVVMEEFSDYQCPYCARFAQETLPTILEQEIATNDVVLMFYDFPLTSLHPQAMAAANAARCAAEQGAPAFWAMHDRLFVNTEDWSGEAANDAFGRFAEELGLDTAQFDGCLQASRYQASIEADMELGRTRGVSSTPSFFLNGQSLVGAQPLEAFLSAIQTVQSGDSIASAPSEAQQPQQPSVKPTPVTIRADDMVASFGDPNAPITIVEYTDYQCPYCARHANETLPSIMSQMVDSGQVYYQVKDFPLDNIHPQARIGAVAARCAAAQDAYWPMHDVLFARQAEWSADGATAPSILSTMAGEVGMDTAEFDDCLQSGQFDAIIQANQDEGIEFGVRGTPAFFINGFPISGAQPYELFEYAVGLAQDGTLADAYVQEETAAEPAPSAPDPSVPVEVNMEGAHSIGDPNAPVVIVEFTDYQCPYCSRHFAQTFPQIQANFIDKGLVRYVFKDFPLESIHPQAHFAAVAARCAGAQDAYFQMHNLLFENQQSWSSGSNTADVFVQLAESAGLDGSAFRTCLDSDQFEDAIDADLAEGVSLGVNGTPAFFINGYFISGAQPYSVFEQAITQLGAAGVTE